MVELLAQFKSPSTGEWFNQDFQVKSYDVQTFRTIVRNLHKSGIVTFVLLTDEASTVVESRSNGDVLYNLDIFHM